jgi:rhodanese-related sulfurtransferase
MSDLALEVTTAETQQQLDQVRLVDCREPDEWEICHIPGAQLIPLSQFPETAPALLPDTQQPIIIYCHHGMRSQRATLWLRAKGYTHVQSMRGGIDAWATDQAPDMARY